MNTTVLLENHPACPEYPNHTSVEGDLGRALRGRYVIPEKGAVNTMRLFLDGHGELLEAFRLKATFSQDPRKFSSKRSFVVVPREERD